MATPNTVADLYPSKWLKADDLGGVANRVTISAVTVETFRQPDRTSKQAAVVSFERATKRMICNVTQCRALAAVCGSECFTDWIGHAVTLAPGTAPNGKATITVRAA